jgi:hypothetical protein
MPGKVQLGRFEVTLADGVTRPWRISVLDFFAALALSPSNAIANTKRIMKYLDGVFIADFHSDIPSELDAPRRREVLEV